MKRIGVLALQGAFTEHIAMLQRLDVEAVAVRLPSQLKGSEGVIIPGGESTTIGKLMATYELLPELQRLSRDGIPIWGTCAGMILMARKASDLKEPILGVMDIEVTRNAFGRQADSFEADLAMPALGEVPFHAVFIRAPLIEEAGAGVEILARLPNGTIVAARQGNLLATAFHPELTPDLRLHAYFLRMGRNC